MSADIQVEGYTTQAQKMSALGKLATKLEKDTANFGPGTLMRMGSKTYVKVPVLSTGFVHWDHEALGAGGIPRGRIIEIFGPESGGKTTIALQLIKEQQDTGGTAAFIDAEHALDPDWGKKLGVDMDSLFINQPDNAEEAMQVVEALIDSQAADIIVVDSVAALVCRAELAGDIGDSHIGLLARLMSQTCRMLVGKLKRAQNLPILIFLNQIREKVGVSYGNPETQPGGRALKFYSSVRVDIRRRNWISPRGTDALTTGEMPVGQTMKLKMVKNKVGSPFRETFIDLRFPDHDLGVGFDKTKQVISVAFERGVVAPLAEGKTKYGLWIDGKLSGDPIETGKDKTAATILEDADLFSRVQAEVIRKLTAPKVEAI
jgi:recombination protein RecA